MTELLDFVKNHVDVLSTEDAAKVEDKTKVADLIMFHVRVKDSPDAEKFRELIKGHQQGVFNNVDVFDGKEHSYLELGGWTGDQTSALMLMGLASLLGLVNLITPRLLPGIPEEMVRNMAGAGFITIMAR